ncbi:hypothetical protein Ciccas_006381 [Cichlidogyrus casuarinus]|uniref:SCP domain-containing protein n=1 Tax=Cichlidogyrus casuarinus TaxID=1844966 RepID=A0ABD2Q5X3_9PLAT
MKVVIFVLAYVVIGTMGLTQKERDDFLNTHNEMRKLLLAGKVSGQQKAGSMRTMKWDSGLEKTAQKKADSCVFAHDKSPDRTPSDGLKSPIYKWIGQNLALLGSTASQFDIQEGVRSWWAENKSYNYKKNSCKSGEQCGHYTQMAWAKTTNLGCAYTKCAQNNKIPMPWVLIVCNYAPGGNIANRKPY